MSDSKSAAGVPAETPRPALESLLKRIDEQIDPRRVEWCGEVIVRLLTDCKTALSVLGVPPAATPPQEQAADLVRRWNSFLGNGGFFNPGMTAICNEDALRELVLNTRDFLVAPSALKETP